MAIVIKQGKLHLPRAFKSYYHKVCGSTIQFFQADKFFRDYDDREVVLCPVCNHHIYFSELEIDDEKFEDEIAKDK